jgi:hypothetical protein
MIETHGSFLYKKCGLSNLRTLPFGYSFAHPVTFHKNRNIPTLAEDVHFFIICD